MTKIIEALKEARKCIARLTPFPDSENDDDFLLEAIVKTGDYADEVRKKLTKLIKELEGKEIVIKDG